MIHLIVKSLLVTIILTGTISPVLAYTHSIDTSHTEQHESSGLADEHGHDQTSGCDHCCHFSSHSNGIFSQFFKFQHLINSKQLSFHSTLYESLIVSPPLPPPNF